MKLMAGLLLILSLIVVAISQDPPATVKSDTVTRVQRDTLMVEQAIARSKLDSLINEKQKK
jgi:hypothetical protein